MNIRREKSTSEKGFHLLRTLSYGTVLVKWNIYNLGRALKILATWLLKKI